MFESSGRTEDPWVLPSRGRNEKQEERAGRTRGCGTVRNQVQDSGHDISRTGRCNGTSPVKDEVQSHCPRECEISDRKSTRLNSSHEWISYAVFCLKKKTI